MSTVPSNHNSSGFLPYQTTTPAQRAQALAHTQQLLQQRFPSLTNAHWADLFAQYEPTLWVGGEPQTAVVEENVLASFANWIYGSHESTQDANPPLYSPEARYLAQNVVSWSQLASDLLATDPELTTPESVEKMRGLFQRLSVGNAVAERICQVCLEARRAH